MKTGWTMAAAAALLLAGPARAEVVDMAAITCGELLDMKGDDAGTILVWVHGYFGGKNDDTRFDLKAFENAAKEIGAYCAKNKKVTLISAAKEVLN
jgi:hypothetical protein